MTSSFSSGTADIYIFADVIENGMELVGQKEIQEYITKFNENSQDTPEDLQDKANAFWDNLKNWKCVNDDGTYDLLAYSKKYCMMDCEVLKIGMEK